MFKIEIHDACSMARTLLMAYTVSMPLSFCFQSTSIGGPHDWVSGIYISFWLVMTLLIYVIWLVMLSTVFRGKKFKPNIFTNLINIYVVLAPFFWFFI